MTRSKSVKRALCASLLFSLSIAHAFTTKPEFACGTYRVQGVMAFNTQGHSILRVQDKTPSAYELIMFGGAIDMKLALSGKMVSALVYVPQPIHDNTRPIVAFQKWMPPDMPPIEPVQLVETEACGLKAKYKQN